MFVIGLKREPNMRMVMSKDALDALFRMWEAAGLGMHRPGTTGRGKSTGPRFFFKEVTAADFPDDWFDPNVEPGQYKASPSSLLSFIATISGGYKGCSKTNMIKGTQQPAVPRATAVLGGDIPAPAHAAIAGMNARLFVIDDRGCGVLMNGTWPPIGLTSWLQTNGASDAGRGFVRLWHREIQGALHQFASLGTATPTQLPWYPHRTLGTEQHDMHMPTPQASENSAVAQTLPPPTLPVCADTNMCHRADISFTSSCQYFYRFNK